MARALPVVPIDAVWYPGPADEAAAWEGSTFRPSLSLLPNFPPPAAVQVRTREGTEWHTLVARTHEDAPEAATVRLHRRRV